ncbi:MAG: discoidin domain-containing protein [Planctomycetes bacterium]|nr:discoidin domain-containing protein [Planctomycetota bacterium]
MRTLVVLTLVSVCSAQPINHALTGTASQSTTLFGGAASNAIDGNPDGHWTNGSVSHTTNLANQWWEVALTAPQVIDELRLYNRADCCGLRLSNFRVSAFLGMTLMFTQDFYTTTGSVPLGDVERIELPAATVGDRVRVEILGMNNNGDGVLSLAEVAVLQYGPLPDVNIAPLGTALQSSTGSGGLPERAIDGNRDGYWINASVSHTANNGALNSWWQVAFANQEQVDVIRLWNRSDCCANRLSNFRVSVWDGLNQIWFQDNYTTTGNVPAGQSWEVALPPGTTGNRVRVELLGLNLTGNSILSLAECEVIRREAGLVPDVTRISAATGGTQALVIDAGTSRAGMTHLLLGTASGVTPGITVSGFAVPLNPDPWTDFMLLAPNGWPYANTVGIVNLHGKAVATLTVPPGLTALIGTSLHHVFGVVDGNGSLVAVSNPSPLTLDP